MSQSIAVLASGLTKRAATVLDSLRAFRQFLWLKLDSGKVALSRPTHRLRIQLLRPQSGGFL